MCKIKCKFFYIVVKAKKFPEHNLFYTIHKYTKKVKLFFQTFQKRTMTFTHSKKLSGSSTRELPDSQSFRT
jgi:hypothetical protein